MKQLHMHCISTDFDGVALRQPKHWRSFTTAFFRQVDTIIHELETAGEVGIDFQAIKSLMKSPLACHCCGAVLGTLPAVKRHRHARLEHAELRFALGLPEKHVAYHWFSCVGFPRYSMKVRV